MRAINLKNTSPSSDHWDGQDYALHSSMQYTYAMEVLQHCTFQATDHILDIGCGDGKITALIAEKVPQGHVLGLDPSPSMLEHAKKFETIQSNLSFLQKDATQLSFIDEFNWVTSFSCLHWIADQLALWTGIYKALKPRGKAVVLFFRKQKKFWDVVDQTIAQPQWVDYFHDYHAPVHLPECERSQEAYVQLLNDCGFQVDFMEEETRLFPFENKKVAADFVAAWLPQLSRIPMLEHQLFMSQFGDCYFPSLADASSEKIKMPFTHRLFSVTKRPF